MKGAKIISWILHPLAMPLIGVFFIMNSGIIPGYTAGKLENFIYLIVGAGTILLPLSFIPFFLYSHKIKSVFMEESRERTIPLMVTLFAFFFTYMLLRYLPVSWLVKKYMLGATITVLFVFLINFRWKISAHMTGIGGLSGMIMVMILRYQMDFLFFFALSIFIAGITGTARLWLQSHKPSEVYSGYLLGLAIVSMVMIL